MKVLVATLLFALTLPLAGAAPVLAQASRAQSPAALRASLDSIMKASYRANEPGAAVLVVHRGRVLLREGYGMANLELGVRVRPEHVFRVGSMTKQFTGVATLMLAEEGKLSLGDPITRFLPDYPAHARTVTIEHLLAHTSGIKNYTNLPNWPTLGRIDYSLPELIALFSNEPLDFEPGERWSYSNSGYVLLGAIIERASGMRYADFLRTRIFEPLGMSSTTYDETARIIPNRIPGYMPQGDGWINAEFISMTQPHAAGALLSNVDDLAKWDAAITGGKLMSAASWRRAFTPARLNDGRSTDYGAGWINGRLGPYATIEHGGGIPGFIVDAMRIPDQQLLVVVLTNASPPRTSPDRVMLQLASRTLNIPMPPPAVALAPARLDEYVGVYRIDSVNTRTISRTGDRLFSQRAGGDRFEIYPIGVDRFAFRETASTITFLREGGRVTAMELQPRLGMSDRAQRESDVAAAPRPAITLEPRVLDRFVGVYELAPNSIITVTREGASLYGQASGQPRFALAAETETRFRIEQVDARIQFHLEGDRVTALTLHQAGRDMRAPRKG